LEIPRIAGWSGDYDYPNITLTLSLVALDLKELSDHPEIVKSHSWLLKTAKNFSDLQKQIENMRTDLTKAPLYHWLESVKEGGHSLANLLGNLRKNHFEDLSDFKAYMSDLTTNDPEGLALLTQYVQNALQGKIEPF
jgi:hypothetical protein